MRGSTLSQSLSQEGEGLALAQARDVRISIWGNPGFGE